MRVAVYHNNSDIRIEEAPIPAIGQGELLVRVFSSGICGTDVVEWYRTKKGPRILGHEIAGEIIESKSRSYKKGQRVFASHHVPCNRCKYCLAGNHTACETLHKGNYDPGGYSEFVRIPRINAERGVYILPENISCDDATMIEPLACAIRGQRVAGVKRGQTVLVLGSGVSGLLNIKLAKKAFAKVIATDINKYRLKKAKEAGADQAVDAARLPEIAADKVIVCTGAASAVGQAFGRVDRKGVILFFAIPGTEIKVPAEDLWRNEVTITSSYGAAPSDLQEALFMIKNGRINVREMITHRLPFEKIEEGFRIVSEAKESLKVVLNPI
jgi:L-iditol 2-dehydrogenase